jgi:phospholipid/cholesterol/gamma-HCH transport system substrate-binding protein
MTATRRKNDALVGTAVVVVSSVMIALVLWLNQSTIGDRRDKVHVRARDVGSASLGSPVVIRGVKSGQIDQIALGDSGWVILRLALDRGVLLPPNPVVLLTSSSLFGEWQATITSIDGLPNNRDIRRNIEEAMVRAPSGVRSDTLPGALVPDIAQLTAVAGNIASDVAEVADRVRTAFDDEAARELRNSIRNIADLSAELKRTVARQSINLDTVSLDVRRGIRDLSIAAASIDSVARRLDASTSRGEITEIISTVQQASKEMLVAAEQVRTIFVDVSKTQERLDRTVATADTLMQKLNRGDGTIGLLINDPRLYQQSDSLVTDLRAMLADFRANPRRYINLRIF